MWSWERWWHWGESGERALGMREREAEEEEEDE